MISCLSSTSERLDIPFFSSTSTALFGEALLAVSKKKSVNQKDGKIEAQGRDGNDETAKKSTSRAMKMMYQMDAQEMEEKLREDVSSLRFGVCFVLCVRVLCALSGLFVLLSCTLLLNVATTANPLWSLARLLSFCSAARTYISHAHTYSPITCQRWKTKSKCSARKRWRN